MHGAITPLPCMPSQHTQVKLYLRLCNEDWGMMLTNHPHLVLRLWKSRAIPLLPYGPIWPATGWNLTQWR